MRHENILHFAIMLFIIALFSAEGSTQVQTSESGRVGMSFLTLAPSARIAAMGGGGFAAYQGSSSQWSNPSLITRTNSRTAEFSHTEWTSDITREYASLVTGLDHGSLGLSVQLLDSGDIDGRSDYGAPTGDYNITTAALSVAYALDLNDWLAVGAAYHRLYQKISEETAGGNAFDLGLTVSPPVTGFSFGISARNYGRMSKLREERTELPENIGFGAAYTASAPMTGRAYTILADFIFPKYGDNAIRVGCEYNAAEHFVLRLGYRDDSYFEDFTYGLGILWDRITADVTYSPLNDISEDALRFTLAITGF